MSGLAVAWGNSNRKDHELSEAQAKYPVIRSKEELYYFRLFTDYFGTSHAVSTVGQWLSL